MRQGRGMLKATRVLCVPVSVVTAVRDVGHDCPVALCRRRVPGVPRGVRSNGSFAGWDEDSVECVPGACGVMPVGRSVKVSAVSARWRRSSDRKGGAADGMDPAAVLVAGEVAYAVNSVAGLRAADFMSARARGGEGRFTPVVKGWEFVVERAAARSGHVGDAGDDGRLSLEVNVAPAQAQGEHGVSGIRTAVDQRTHGKGAGARLAHHFQKMGRSQPRTGPRCGNKQDLPVVPSGLRHGRAGFLQGFDDAGCQAASSATSPGSGVPSSHCRKAPPAVET